MRRLRAQVVAGAAAHERHLRAEDAVGPANDLLLVAGQSVRQQKEDAMCLGFELAGGSSHLCTRLAES